MQENKPKRKKIAMVDPYSDPPTRYQLEKFALHAPPGTRFTYHAGELAHDRERDPELAAIADRARELSEAGVVVLLQRRVCDAGYIYFAERRS